MNVLVINCGSSSIKYCCYDARVEKRLAQGLLERIGEKGSRLTHRTQTASHEIARDIQDHEQGLSLIAETLADPRVGVLRRLEDVAAVGHRVVHGAEDFVESTLIDDDVLAAIERCQELAPLHNPPNLAGIRAARRRFPNAAQVAVFDTAFHETMPKHAYIYAIPYPLYEDFRVRRYGFHGTSHRYVAREAARLLGKPLDQSNLITCHLGNGCSVAAIRNGKSVDTSMGLTPLEGLVMGTRSGDIDPAIIFFLAGSHDMTYENVNRLLNRESGLLGVSGVSNDLRNVREAALKGNERAALAIDIFAYRLKKYIGAYLAVLGRTDCVVFTGGIGENAAFMRALAVSDMEPLGLRLDPAMNDSHKGDGFISSPDSPVRLAVVRTDEEKMIALDTLEVARSHKRLD
ncbi:MAG: acetate kinase [Planctomycetota bacterium]